MGSSILYIQIFSILAIIYITVRMYLENEAMSKAYYVAKDYMEKVKLQNTNITEEDVKVLLNNFEKLNKIGIPLTNFQLVAINLLKVIILSIIALVI